ncbi:hypothetical protein H2203_001555 [Taxawa tesnikishii (nom. ined.)]|nr:hypothetical protein H2203_001555 [Dothideales sp. JES 119]
MDLVSLFKRADENHGCTKDTCPASESVYGYAPSLGASAFFTAFFFLSGIAYIFQGFRYRRWWGFASAMALGTVLEGVGYISRIILHNDPFSDVGFKLNVVLLTFAPAFLSAGIYLLLKQLTITFSPALSRLRPAWYTYIFITCDLVSIVLQGAGGALSAAAETKSALDNGEHIMVAGLVLQVFTLAVFGYLVAEYGVRVTKHRDQLNAGAWDRVRSWRFRLFLVSIVVAYLAIMTRCSYRVAELSGGWRNPIMRKEGEFIGLDSVMCALAALMFNIFHPGACFHRPQVPSTRSEADVEIQTKTSQDDLPSL